MIAMQDTFHRYLVMLMLIPRYPASISTERLKEKLEQFSFDISLRSIQRDLNKLSVRFPLVSNEEKQQGWSWKEDAGQFTLPALDSQAALAFYMAKQHIEPLLPASTVVHLQPWFLTAEKVLSYGDGLAKWPQKVRVLPPGIQRLPPQINTEVQSAVSEAVLQEKQLEVTYLANGADTPWTRTIHPLALVVRDRVIYLLSVFEGHSDTRQLVLHRMQKATILDAPAKRPADFDLDAAIEQGELSMPLGKHPIRLEALFSRHVAIHLIESPIAPDQTIEEEDEEDVRLTATVPDTFELRLWLKSFGDEVAIVKPASLRREFRDMAENLAAYYDIAAESTD
ncbi:MAG: WYL domain-containing protein [Sterolibacterium sp.]